MLINKLCIALKEVLTDYSLSLTYILIIIIFYIIWKLDVEFIVLIILINIINYLFN